MKSKAPTYFISHGGGPWPWIPEMRSFFAPLEASLKQMILNHGEKPTAVLMISGHWQEDIATVMGHPNPPMYYDYYGFPEETYQIRYPAPGAPELALKTEALLHSAGLEAAMDTIRGFDHGVFAPMEVMYPDADVPLFQLSLLSSYDPAQHLEIGRAIAPLREEGIMIVGSGLSFHNLRLPRGAGNVASAQFDEWLFNTMSSAPEDRTEAAVNWAQAPGARICHEDEDHLLPLFVALGAAENEVATRIYHHKSEMTGNTVSNYRFG